MAAPVIVVPSGSIVLPATSTALTGISISESGAGPTTQFTTTVVAASGTLTATGTGVSGSGTSSITIAGTSAQTNTALATLHVTEPSAIYSTDTITVNSHDAGNNTATPEQIAIVSDGHSYLTFPTLAAAQARSQTQALAVGCDGVRTTYWWPVVATATGGAVQITPGDPYFDQSVPPNAVQIVASFTGSISGTTLTAPANIGLRPGLVLGGNSNITPVTLIIGGSGTTWTVSKPQTVASSSMVAATTYLNPAVLPSAWLTSGEQSSLVTAPNAGFAAPTISAGVVVP